MTYESVFRLTEGRGESSLPPPLISTHEGSVRGAHIVVECVPEELEQSQLNHLKEEVENTNRKFSEWAAKNNAEILRQLRERVAAREQLENLRNRRRFD